MQPRYGRLGTYAAALVICCLIRTAGLAVDLPASAFRAGGWNTWNIDRLNAMIHLPDGIGLELTIYDPKTRKSFGNPRLEDVRHFGAHAPDGSYCFARYKQNGYTYEMEFASRGDLLLAHVHPMTTSRYRLVADLSFYFGRNGTVRRQGSFLVGSGTGSRFVAQSPDPQMIQREIGSEHRMEWDLTGDRWIVVTTQSNRFSSDAGYQSEVEGLREEYERTRVRSDGILENGAEAASDIAAWNVVWNPRRNIPVTTVGREFPMGSGISWGGYIQGCWDAVFQSIIADLQSPSMAEASIRGLLADTTPSGMFTGGTGWGISEDHSQPPLIAYALLKFYKEHGDKKLLSEAFPALYRWHQWWPTARDGNHDGLLEWGSNPVTRPAALAYYQKVIDVLNGYMGQRGIQHPHLQISDVMDGLRAAGMESGLDNSPMWDGVIFNKQTHTMEQDDVGLNSLFSLDGWALAEIAHILGRYPEEEQLRRESVEMGERINRMMWSKEDGMYLNRRWDGSFNPRISPTNFYPLLAGISGPERTREMVQRYLLNPQKFLGKYVIPVTPRDDPAFKDQAYWRGRIWPPTNYLVYEGLKRNAMDEVAAEVAIKSTQLFQKEWRLKGHIHENYNATNGQGDDIGNESVTYYGWGGLLPLMMVQELIDVEPWSSGLRFGSLGSISASVTNVRMMDNSYDVFLGPGLRVMRNGKEFIESDHPIVLRDFRQTADSVHFEITAKTNSTLKLFGFRNNEKLQSVVPRELLTARDGTIVLNVTPEMKKVDLRREDH